MITLQDNPFPDMKQEVFDEIAETIEENHGLLGKLFIESMKARKSI
ncbi:hypothetical protein J4710_02230 [Staphylococcus xylosus]|uniref:Uncharacterized protein n=1 Tax=Staphylococcus xylosus TaxID=1288 RepID=A0A939ND19_STAXY|nr:hypothetical protein [Staphylococcus xylosus]